MSICVPEEIKTGLKGKRLIFTVTPGRSGSNYLAEMLSFVPNVVSYHEPEPEFADVMRAVQQDMNVAYEFWIGRKLPQIVKEQAPIYIETSNLFCKGFIEPLLNLGIIPDLIILTRPHREVAKSFYQLSVPARSELGLKYLLSPEDPGVLPLPNWRDMHDYQLCYWYCLEIERRSQKYEEMFRKIDARVVRISLNEVTTIVGFYKLLKQLGLSKFGVTDWLRYWRNHARRINTKADLKALTEAPNDIESLEQEVLNSVRNI